MKANKQLLKITSILCALPLLMGNSPRPYPVSKNYKNFEITAVEKETTSDHQTLYDFTIKNTGKGFIGGDKNIYYDSGDNKKFFTAELNVEFIFGGEQLIAPGQSHTFSALIKTNTYDFSSKNFYTYAFEDIDEDVKFEGSKALSKDPDVKDSYIVDLKVSNLNDNYGYYYAVEMEYDGKHISAMCEKNADNKIAFKAEESFDMSKATVTKVFALKYNIYQYKGIAIILEIILIMMLVALGIVLIAPAIVLPIVFTARKKRRQRATADAANKKE